MFSPLALNVSCFLLGNQLIFEPLLIVVFESLNCPQCEKMDLKIIQSLLERVQICKRCWKTEEYAGHFVKKKRILKNSAPFICSEQIKETCKQPSQNKKMCQIIPLTTHSNIFSYFFVFSGLYVNIFYANI